MTRSDKHINNILAVVGDFWKGHRDLRLCQLIVNTNDGKDPYHVEDGALFEAMSGEPMLQAQPIAEDKPSIKVGDWFKQIDESDGATAIYQVVGAVKGSKSGPCFLANRHGWSYTGLAVHVKDVHHITADEFKEMSGGHIFVKTEEKEK